jgi:hypothetical protein
LNVSVFEAVFAAACRRPLDQGTAVEPLLEAQLSALKSDPDFVKAASAKSTDKSRVAARLERASALLFSE